MLIMRRRAGERLTIGSDVELEILEIGPTRVKIGISAPRNLPITRKEAVTTRAQNLKASEPTQMHKIERLSEQLMSRFTRR